VGTLSSDAGLIAAALGLVALASTVPALSAAARVKPTAPGESGDIFDDLGPVVPGDLRGHPWRLAVVFAIAVAVVITLAAVPAQDVYDGALRGLLDAAACLVGFAVLGPFLGLWQPARPARPDRPAAA
jgi:hypothetical protein